MRWTRSTSSEAASGVAGDRGPAAPDAPRADAAPRPRGTGPAGFWEGVRRLLPVARTAMEYCWLYPWIVVIGGGFYGLTGPVLGPGWALLLLVGGQMAVKPVLARSHTLQQARGILVAAGLVLGFLAVRAQHYPDIAAWHPAWIGALLRTAHDALPAVPKPALGALVAACLWWRGLALGVREVDATTIDEAYKTGVAMIVFYFIGAAIYSDAQGFLAAGPTLPGSLPAFFFIGLSALALAHLATIWDRGHPDERAHFQARAWALIVVGVVGLILLAAGMSAGLAAADVTTYLGLALRPLLPVVEWLFLALFFVAEIVVTIIIAVLSRLPRREMRELPTPPTVFDGLLRRLREIRMDPTVIEGARWTMVIAVVLLLAIGMALTIVLMRRRERKTGEDEHESVWSVQEMWSGLVRGLRRRWRRAEREEPSAAGAQAIRRIYREMLRVGMGLGARRPLWATPREYQPRLVGAVPEAADDVAVVTEAYERVRYGAWEPSEASVGMVEAGLARIKSAAAPEV